MVPTVRVYFYFYSSRIYFLGNLDVFVCLDSVIDSRLLGLLDESLDNPIDRFKTACCKKSSYYLQTPNFPSRSTTM